MPKEQGVYKDEDGRVLLGAVKKQVMEEVESHLQEMTARMDGYDEGKKTVDEELAYIKSKLAEVGATARAAAIASAVPVDTHKKWEPLPLEKYPKGWVEEHGVVDIAISPDYKHPSITINTLVIPVKPGVVFQVPGNVAKALEELGLLGMGGE